MDRVVLAQAAEGVNIFGTLPSALSPVPHVILFGDENFSPCGFMELCPPLTP